MVEGRLSPLLVTVAVAVALAVTTALVMVTGGDGDSPPVAGRTSSPSPTTTGPTTPPKTCIVGGAGAETLQITVEQAEKLTTEAVRVLDMPNRRAVFADTVVRVLTVSRHTARAVTTAMIAGLNPLPLSCAHVRTDVDPEKPGPDGLTPRAARLRQAWTKVFGPMTAGGFGRNLKTGHVDNSAHYQGRAIDVFFRPAKSPDQRRRGWVFAQWLVVRAPQYHVLSVIYSDHLWTSWASTSGWRSYEHPSGDTDNPTLRHLDHVHVAVESGHRGQGR